MKQQGIEHRRNKASRNRTGGMKQQGLGQRERRIKE
jgi:hypothetical protein